MRDATRGMDIRNVFSQGKIAGGMDLPVRGNLSLACRLDVPSLGQARPGRRLVSGASWFHYGLEHRCEA
jgi:hypothetical protein